MNPNANVQQIMTTKLVTVTPTTTLKVVEDLFKKNAFHHLPVVNPGSELVGMISKHDLEQFERWWMEETTGKTLTRINLSTLTADRIMTKSVLSIEPEDTIGLAADIFMANKFHALPVVDDDQLVGIVTVHDLLLYSFQSAVSMDEENL